MNDREIRKDVSFLQQAFLAKIRENVSIICYNYAYKHGHWILRKLKPLQSIAATIVA